MSHPGPFALLPALIAVAAVLHGSGSVAWAEPVKCRAALVKQLAAYGRSVLAALQRCEDAVVAGKRPAATVCASEPDVAEAIASARGKLAKQVAAKCGGKDKQCDPADVGPDADDALAALGWDGLSCPAAAGAGCVAAVNDCGDIGACVACAGDAPVRDAVANAYDALAPPGGPVDKTLRKCQRAIGKEAAKLFAVASKLGEACWAKVSAGKAGFAAPCPAGDASGATLAKTAAARTRAVDKICKACGGKDGRCGTADDLAVAAIGYALSCPAVTIPGGAACGGAVETVPDVATCATCVAEFHAQCLGALAAPWGGAYPAFCAAAAGIPFRELPGDPSTPLVDGTFAFTPGIGFDPAEATDGVVRTRITVVFEPGATVAQANAVIASLDGEVLSMLGNVAILLLRIPDPGSLAALDALLAATGAAPGVDFAARDFVPDLQELPAKFPRPLGRDVSGDPGLDLLKHLIAARVPAAWNAAPPPEGSVNPPPTFILADAFGAGEPSNLLYAIDTFPVDFRKQPPSDHGYEVLGMALGRLTGQAPNCLVDVAGVDRARCAVGIYPSVASLEKTTVLVRAVDVTPVAGKLVSIQEIEDVLVYRTLFYITLPPIGGSNDVVMNTSLGVNAIAGNLKDVREQAAIWIEKVRKNGLEASVLHVTAAGNVVKEKPGIADAATASPFTAAALIDGLDVPNLTNVLVVEDRTVGPYPFLPGALSKESKVGGHLSAVATNVWTTKGFASGTSLAAPQVAGLATALWQRRSDYTPQKIRQLLIDRARPAVDGAPMIDAYATMLAADTSFTDAPIRKSLLDIDDDGDFDRKDVERFFNDWKKADTLAGRLYTRVDLRGARGAEDVAFDLDLDGDADGASIPVEGRGENDVWQASFNEAAIERDEEIVCYNAFAPLYTRDPQMLIGDAGQRQCCEWLRENGRLPAEAPCYTGCQRSGARDGTCEPEDVPLAGGWSLFCGNGMGFNPGFALLEDGTMMEGLDSVSWWKTGTWTTDGASIILTYCPVEPLSGRATFTFEGTWSAAPVPAEFGVVSCNAVGSTCPAMKGTLTQRTAAGTVFRTVECDSRQRGGVPGFRVFADPRDQVCHGGCFERFNFSWPHLCRADRCSCANYQTVGCPADMENDTCPDDLVCRAVIDVPAPFTFIYRCVPPVETSCTTTADCPSGMTCCPGSTGCGTAATPWPWLRSLCLHDPDVP